MKSIYTYLLLLLMMVHSTLMAQFVIPDPNFKQFLLNNYPSVINPDQTLNTAAAASVTGPFQCYNKGITNLAGIQYFTGISTLEVKYNPDLTSLPNISSLTNLTILGLDSNGLTSLPPLSSLTGLLILSFHHNKVSSIPSLAGLSQLQDMLVQHNNLTSLPDLTSQVNLEQIYCGDNPLVSLPDFSTLVKLKKLLCQRTNLTAIPSLNNCPLLEYLICTNNKVTSLPAMNNCTLLKELKVFNCQLTSLPDLSIYTGLYSVKVNGNFLSFEDLLPLTNNPFYNTTDFVLMPQQTLGTTQTISVQELSSVTINPGIDASLTSNTYTWYLNNTFYRSTTIADGKLDFYSVKSFDAGTYFCVITNSLAVFSGMSLTTAPTTLITSTASEEPVFYPNGDGIADTYFINETGYANIYNREGEIVKKLTIPANWDGTKTNGQEAPSGLYVIEINGNSSVRITLLR